VAVLAIAGTVGWALRDREARTEEQAREAARRVAQTKQGVRQALEQAARLRAELHTELKDKGTRTLLNQPARWHALIKTAQSELARAQVLAAGAEGPLDAALTGRMQRLARALAGDEADYRLALRLEQIRLDRAVIVEGKTFDFAQAEREYPLAFAAAGLAVEPGRENDLAGRISVSPIREQLLASLDDWAWVAERGKHAKLAQRLLAVARLVDPDSWRDQIRDPATRKNKDALVQLAGAAQADPKHLKRLSPEMLAAVALILRGNHLKAETWLRKAQAQHPADFWINFHLANVLGSSKDKRPEAIGFFRAALALRPDSTAVYNNLGIALQNQKDLPAAIDAYQKALALAPQSARTWNNLGVALYDQKDLPAAVDAYQKALALDPQDAQVWYSLGNALREQQDLPAAVEAYKKAVRFNRNFAEAHCLLGHALMDLGEFAEALPALQKGHELGSRKPGWPHPSAGWVKNCEQLLAPEKRLPEVLRGDPAGPAEQLSLADLCLRYKKRYGDAALLYGKALAAEPKRGEGLGNVLRYNAACAAVLAASGKGAGADKLDAPHKALLRRQALDWLQADLAERAKLLAQNPATAEPIRKDLQSWLDDADLSSVRDAKGRVTLPQEERAIWMKLWGDVRDLLDRAQNK
jgi:tetratricopeptide (TPR) repeat protein